mgnify:FL=1
MRIRMAGLEDAAALLAIYAPYVRETAITFEYDVPSEEEFRRRIESTLRKYPYLVLEREGDILGYAYAGPLHSRPAYDWAVETSIYLDQNARGGGLGRKLHDALEAVLREQGVNSHVEMAAAFHRAGFDAIDVHMSDLLGGRIGLGNFQALVACGGFSYGDVLGAGEGWAKSILFNNRVRDEFETFFHRPQTLALGVCNGCQMMSNLRELIPGSELWPRFVRNHSDRFEARFSLVEVTQSPSLLLADMVGSMMPIAVSHGEGRVEVRDGAHLAALESKGLVALRYVDNFGKVTETYPANPNGSPNGITAVTTENGRVTIMMPHPERVFRTVSNSWHPENWGEDSPWMRIFRNARKQLG